MPEQKRARIESPTAKRQQQRTRAWRNEYFMITNYLAFIIAQNRAEALGLFSGGRKSTLKHDTNNFRDSLAHPKKINSHDFSPFFHVRPRSVLHTHSRSAQLKQKLTTAKHAHKPQTVRRSL